MTETGKKKFYIVSLMLIVLVAVLIRTWQFGTIPGGMNQDGAMAAVDAKALAEYGTDRFGMRYPVHLTAWGYGQMSALMSYLMAPCIKLLGLSVFSARLPMLLVSLAALGMLALFAREAGGKPLLLIVFFFAAINPWHILQSRWALDCNLFPHFLLGGFTLLTLSVSRNRHWLTASMILFALSMYCYGISIYTVPVLLLFSCILLLRRKLITLRQALAAAAVYILFAWPFIACMMINTFRLKTIETPLFTIPFFPYSMRSSDILFFSDKPLQQLLLNGKSLFRIIFQVYNGYVFNEVRGFGTLYVFSVPFMLTGCILCFFRFRNNTVCALTVIWFLTAVYAGLVTANVNINRINILFYPLILFTGIGALAFLRLFRKAAVQNTAASLLTLTYLTAFGLFSFTYFTSYAVLLEDSFMADFGKAVTALRNSDAEKIYVSADAQYKGYSHVSEILTLFYMDIDAHTYQSQAFQERFSFRIPDIPDPAENAAYVLAKDDLPKFDSGLFRISNYGKFLTAEKAP